MGALRARVLTVDDDRDTADTTADLRRLDGHDVRAVYDGHEAVETARTFWPHVVILDVNMPGLDGYEVGYLEDIYDFNPVKVIIGLYRTPVTRCAVQFLRSELRDGPKPVKAIFREARRRPQRTHDQARQL